MGMFECAQASIADIFKVHVMSTKSMSLYMLLSFQGATINAKGSLLISSTLVIMCTFVPCRY